MHAYPLLSLPDYFFFSSVKRKREASQSPRSNAAKRSRISDEEPEDGLAEDVNDLV